MPGAALTAFLVFIVIAMPLRAWRRWIHQAPPTKDWIHVLETGTLSVVLLSILHYEGVPLASIGLHAVPLPRFAIHVLGGFLIVISPDIVSLLIWYLDPPSIKQAELARFEAIPSGKRAIAFIPLCLISSFWEETCFRGTALYVASQGFYATATGVAVSSAVFGLVHLRQGCLSVVFTTAFGLAFCAIYLTTDDLFALIISHALGNLAVVYYFAPMVRRRARNHFDAF